LASAEDLDTLTDARRAVSRARDATAAELEALTGQRDRLITICYRAGLTIREIARIAGLHYTRVGAIVRELGLDCELDMPEAIPVDPRYKL
jgi:DNA-directed RNA polymerase specialized sigma24 family protein